MSDYRSPLTQFLGTSLRLLTLSSEYGPDPILETRFNTQTQLSADGYFISANRMSSCLPSCLKFCYLFSFIFEGSGSTNSSLTGHPTEHTTAFLSLHVHVGILMNPYQMSTASKMNAIILIDFGMTASGKNTCYISLFFLTS